MKRAAIYLRVSTALQSTDAQRADVAAVVGRLGLQVVLEFEEQASAVKRRPQFERMMRAAREREFDVLVVWALDRFGRSLAGNVNDLLALDALGVKVVSAREPWLDTAGPVRDLLVAIFSWVAQQERNRLIERTRAGIAVVRQGRPAWGRGSLDTGRLVHPDRRPEALAVARKWAQEGRKAGLVGLATLLGGCSPNTAKKIALEAGLKMTPPSQFKKRGAQNTEAVALVPLEEV